MKYTPYNAFKYVLLKCSSEKGEDSLFQQSRRIGWRFVISGNVKTTFNDGTTVLYSTGDLIEDNETLSGRTIEFLEDTEWFCMSNIGNETLFKPEFITLNKDAELNQIIGSDIFIATGSITIDGKEFTAPYALRVRTKDVTLKANTDCYLFKFK